MPDTIIYFKKKPASWFFTNKKGKIRKKMHHNINNENILKVMCRRNKEDRKNKRVSDIVAYFLSDTKNKDGHEKTLC
jgi:hypothetical protein